MGIIHSVDLEDIFGLSNNWFNDNIIRIIAYVEHSIYIKTIRIELNERGCSTT